jgi:hypothetical protein
MSDKEMKEKKPKKFVNVTIMTAGTDQKGDHYTEECLKQSIPANQSILGTPITKEFDNTLPPVGKVMGFRIDDNKIKVSGLLIDNLIPDEFYIAPYGQILKKNGNKIEKMRLLGTSIVEKHADENATLIKKADLEDA